MIDHADDWLGADGKVCPCEWRSPRTAVKAVRASMILNGVFRSFKQTKRVPYMDQLHLAYDHPRHLTAIIHVSE